jgi:cytidylate kinase
MVVIIISGLAGVGKTTLARRIAKRYKLKFYCGGDILKKVAIQEGYKPGGKDWWDSKEGMRFLSLRKDDLSFDRKLDEELLKLAKKGNAVFTSWTLPWLFKGGIKIWLSASPQERARRVARRDKISFNKALRIVRERDEQNKELYQKLYGIKLGEDFTPFNYVLDTEKFSARDAERIVYLILDTWFRVRK